MICVFAMSVVGHDFKLDMFSYYIFNVSIFIDMFASSVIKLNDEETVLLTYIMTL